MEIRVESVVNTRIASFRRALLKFKNLFFSGKVFGPWILKKSTVGIVCISVTRIAIRGQCFHGKKLHEVDIRMIISEELSVYGRLRKIFRWKAVKDVGFPGFQSKKNQPETT
ncbi:hypothetical protein NC651_000241 [Populus alba x Populus x berolinensis]|nr:hypothetical protein NC651_000241 [Populus alba x Populus x berolinensis]